MKIKLISTLMILMAIVMFIFSGCQVDNIPSNAVIAGENSESNSLLEMPEVKQVIAEISAKIKAGELKPGVIEQSRDPYDINLNPSGPIQTSNTIVSITATASPGQIVGQWYLYKEPNEVTPVELIPSDPPYLPTKTININISRHGEGMFRISALVFSSTGIHTITSPTISITIKKDPVKVTGGESLTTVGTGVWNAPTTWNGYTLFNITANITLTSGQGDPLKITGSNPYWYIGFTSIRSYALALTKNAYSYRVGSAGGEASLFDGLSSGDGADATPTSNTNVYSSPYASSGSIRIDWTGYYQP